jgi:hypothetical protein
MIYTFLSKLAGTHTDLLLPGLISVIVSAAVCYLFKRGETRHSAKVEYEYEQRKKLHEMTGRYHGRLISAANNLNYRLWNLYSNHQDEWLKVDGRYEQTGYYFSSTAYRLMSFFALVRLIESEAILLDARIATRKDFLFLNYIAAFHWVMTDVALFGGSAYDISTQSDHFFSDHFRHCCEICSKEGECLSFEAFKNGPYLNKDFSAVLKFLDGLSPYDGRLRWNRVVALHLLLLAFLNTYGYKRQKTKPAKFLLVAKQVTNLACLKNIVAWLPRHDLDSDTGARNIIKAVKKVSKLGQAGLIDASSRPPTPPLHSGEAGGLI